MPRNPNATTSADGLTTTRDIAWWDENDPQWPGYKGPRSEQELAGDAPYDPVNGASAEARRWLDSQSQSRAPWTTEGRSDASTGIDTQYPIEQPAKGLRGVTDSLERDSVYPGLASIAPPLRSLSALAGGMLIPGGARKLINPDEDESRWGGAGQLGLAALSMLGVRGGGKSQESLNGLVRSAKPAGWSSKAANVSEDGVGANVSNFTAKPKPSPFGKADWDEHLGAIAKRKSASAPEAASGGGGHHRGQPRELDPNRFKGMSGNMWDEAPPGRLSPKLSDKLRQSGSGLDDAAFAGERNVNTSDNPLLDILPDGSEMNQSEFGSNLMDNFRRLGIPNRARAFRDNVPVID